MEKKSSGNTESNFRQIFAIRELAFSPNSLGPALPSLGLVTIPPIDSPMENCQQVWLGYDFWTKKTESVSVFPFGPF